MFNILKKKIIILKSTLKVADGLNYMFQLANRTY